MHKIHGIWVAVVLGGVAYLGAVPFLAAQQAALVGVVTAMVACWSSESLPLGVVSLLPVILFPLFDILPSNELTPNYAKPIIFLFFGGFMIAIAVEKTLLHQVLTHHILRFFPATQKGMVYSLVLTSGILSAILSNTATAMLLMPLALYLSDLSTLKSRFVLAIAYGATIGGILTPVGTPSNLIFYGLMDELHMPTIPFLQWIVLVAPLAAAMFWVSGLVLTWGLEDAALEPRLGEPTLTDNQRKVLYWLILLIAILFFNAPIKPYYGGLGLNEKTLLLSFGLALFVPPFNILVWEDCKKIPLEIIFLFGAGFSIAMAFSTTGLADQLAEVIIQFVTLSPELLILSIAILVTFSTELTSNMALTSIMLPVIYTVSERGGLDTRLFMMLATICSSYAFMLPIATAPNAIAMSSGFVHVKTMAKCGLILNVSGIVLITLTVIGFWSRAL